MSHPPHTCQEHPTPMSWPPAVNYTQPRPPSHQGAVFGPPLKILARLQSRTSSGAVQHPPYLLSRYPPRTCKRRSNCPSYTHASTRRYLAYLDRLQHIIRLLHPRQSHAGLRQSMWWIWGRSSHPLSLRLRAAAGWTIMALLSKNITWHRPQFRLRRHLSWTPRTLQNHCVRRQMRGRGTGRW